MRTRLNVTAQRGQAIFETALFMPLILVAMLALLYFAQYGILQQRANEAARYATLMVNESTAEGFTSGSSYSFENLYTSLAGLATFGPSDRYAPMDKYACDSAGPQAASAFYQSAAMPAGSSKSAPGFFHADTTPVGSCKASSLVDVPITGTQSTLVVYVAGVWPPASASDIATVDIAKNAIVIQESEVQASKNVPEFIKQMTGNAWSNTLIKGGMTYSLGYGADALLALYPCFAWTTANSITQMEPKPQPYKNYQATTGPMIASTIIDQLGPHVVIVLGSGGGGGLSPPPSSGVANCPCAQ